MTELETLGTVTTIVRHAFDNDQINLTMESAGKDIPGWDSFHYVDIILRIQEALGVKIRAREANNVKTIGDLVRLIQVKLA